MSPSRGNNAPLIRYRLLVVVLLLCAGMTALGLKRLEFNSDVLSALPAGQQVIADGLAIFQHHPIHEQVAVDVALEGGDQQVLLACAAALERRMRDSGLFSRVGLGATGELLPELAQYAVHALPLLFSAQELEQQVAPRLAPAWVQQRMARLYGELSSMEGIGQAGFIGGDPLGLKDLVLARLAPLAPTQNARMQQGQLLSADGRHVLVVAQPKQAGTDTAAAARMAEFCDTAARELSAQFAAPGRRLTLTPVGAYRAALDNERLIRRDVELALTLSTLGIALLLVFSFPRPLIGLLSLVPAVAGTAAALFVYSLFHRSMSIMALGFGGAVISITVDYGIAYLLFLDQPEETSGHETSREVGAISVMIVFTTMGAFLLLGLSGFPLFAELGQFAALGQFFSFAFVHFILPIIFPRMPASRSRRLPLRRLVDLCYGLGRPGALAAALLALVLLWHARPHFQVSLSRMNTVSEATQAADALFSRVWGDALSRRVFLMRHAGNIAALQQDDDRLLQRLEEDIKGGVLEQGFVPAMLFPGETRGSSNLAAWRAFWHPERRAAFRQALTTAATTSGFDPDGFADFLALLDPPATMAVAPMPEKYFSLLGIAHSGDELVRFVSFTPGEHYDSEGFRRRHAIDNTVFDPDYFATWLGRYLFSSFSTLLAIVGSCMALLLLVAFLHPTLTLLTLTPPAFSFICTLGTLRLLGHPLDIPALMLSVVILGMGIDYAVLCVRAHQRYREFDHPSYALTRNAAFLAGSANLIGFGALIFAEHSLLRSIGLTSLLGIGYCMLGAFLLLPPLLKAYFTRYAPDRCAGSGTTGLAQRVRCRYRTLEAYPRLFARIKLRFDPLFQDLPRLLAGRQGCATILDIGCGYSVPACWCLEFFPTARVAALDPDPERVRVASLVLGQRGCVTRDLAPAMPAFPAQGPANYADIILLLDMLHYLDDATVAGLFRAAFQALTPNGMLVLRCSVPAEHQSRLWRLEEWRIRRSGASPHFRPLPEVAQLLRQTGFDVTVQEVSAANTELAWLVGCKPA
ncbi:MAG: hypothetical protein BWK76_15040 [Desulfobulbaceae bacterium A2]|nr:MAG: hypothetical protein BWK76_15040 [Desulfobulbaceae bacterium A2]